MTRHTVTLHDIDCDRIVAVLAAAGATVATISPAPPAGESSGVGGSEPTEMGGSPTPDTPPLPPPWREVTDEMCERERVWAALNNGGVMAHSTGETAWVERGVRPRTIAWAVRIPGEPAPRHPWTDR